MMKHHKDISIKHLMMFIDAKFPTEELTTEVAKEQYLKVMSGLIGDIEIAMTEVKDMD